jgi:hypothetical protein
MTDIVKQTYLLLAHNNFKLKKKTLWVVEPRWEDKYNLTSVDGKRYSLYISNKRPVAYAIPYELFIEDEISDV